MLIQVNYSLINHVSLARGTKERNQVASDRCGEGRHGQILYGGFDLLGWNIEGFRLGSLHKIMPHLPIRRITNPSAGQAHLCDGHPRPIKIG